jgi:hypothetical protein
VQASATTGVPMTAFHPTPPSSDRARAPELYVLAPAAQLAVGLPGAPPFRSPISAVGGLASPVLTAPRHLSARDLLAFLAPIARPAAESPSVIGALAPARHPTAGAPPPAAAVPAAGSRLVPGVPGALLALSQALPSTAGAPVPSRSASCRTCASRSCSCSSSSARRWFSHAKEL